MDHTGAMKFKQTAPPQTGTNGKGGNSAQFRIRHSRQLLEPNVYVGRVALLENQPRITQLQKVGPAIGVTLAPVGGLKPLKP
jgi:hypothetical protein